MEYTGVILAAGKGTRMYPFSEKYPKPILPIANRPLLEYQIEMMMKVGITDIIIVIGHLGFEIVTQLGTGDKFGLKIKYVEQNSTLGIAHALGALEPFVTKPFVVFLGDIFFVTNSFEKLFQKMEKEKLQSVLVTKIEKNPENIKRNFSVILDDEEYVKRVIEKPKHITNKLKGCGIYLFDLQIFDAIRRTPRTAMRDEYEITEAVQILINDGWKVKHLNIVEEDMNLTFPQDLLYINLEELKRRKLKNIIGNNVNIHPSARLTNCMIGNGVTISKPISLTNCVIFDQTNVDEDSDLFSLIITPEQKITP